MESIQVEKATKDRIILLGGASSPDKTIRCLLEMANRANLDKLAEFKKIIEARIVHHKKSTGDFYSQVDIFEEKLKEDKLLLSILEEIERGGLARRITSIAELKKAIESKKVTGGSTANLNYSAGLQKAIEFVNKLEASVKDNIECIEVDGNYHFSYKEEERLTRIVLEHLHKILGDVVK